MSAATAGDLKKAAFPPPLVSESASPSFLTLFHRPPEVAADAPGRANLIGDHTDYNGGFVLPIPIPQRTWVELAARDDRRVRIASMDCGTPHDIVHYVLGQEVPGRGWVDYVAGVTRELAREGHELTGFDARIRSEVPIGSGLSSSAALEVGLLRALREGFGLHLDDVSLARIGQRAESGFVGARVGIMDQMAASLGEQGSALFLDTRHLSWRQIPLPSGVAFAVLHSGVAHDHARGDYNTRRAECERACELLGIPELRDLAPDRLEGGKLPEPLNRRARHVLTENARVLRALDALRAGDLAELGELFRASHASLRDDYEVSTPEIDLLVELALHEPGFHGARLTGGGFGGSVVMLADPGAVTEGAARIARLYAERTGHLPSVLVPVAMLQEEA